MKSFWFQITLWTGFGAAVLGILLAAWAGNPVHAQAVATDTPVADSGTTYITNTFEGEPAINVRTGPSTIVYPNPCGSLPFGGTAPALGVSPGHEWIEISYPSCPNGTGWVYAANVVVTGSLHVVELPATPEPLATATIDPTLAAAFRVQPTVTRLPTFTPPPPLVVPVFSESGSPPPSLPWGPAIGAFALLGAVVLAVSLLGRR